MNWTLAAEHLPAGVSSLVISGMMERSVDLGMGGMRKGAIAVSEVGLLIHKWGCWGGTVYLTR